MQKIFLIKNKYKILSIFIIFIILIIFAIYLIYQKYNYNYFIEKFENEFDLKVYKKDDYKINFFPKIYFKQNNFEIIKKNNDIELISHNANLEIIKEYLNWKTLKFTLTSPSTTLNNINVRNVIIEGNLKNEKIKILNFFANIDEGEINFTGDFNMGELIDINIDGKFTNVSLTRILNQTNQINWERLNLKLRSDFNLNTYGKNKYDLIKNLNANIPIKGLFYINTTQEEKFGAALLNALTSNLPELSDIGKSLNILITQYADIPSNIEGLIVIDKGVLETNNILISNKEANMNANMTYDILSDNIQGTLTFNEDNGDPIVAKLKGGINAPQILINDISFISGEDEDNLQDLKKIIEKGIVNIFQNLLEKDN